MVSKLMRTAAKDRQLLIYRFSPKDVNWQEKLVYGHYRLSKKKENWKSGPSPIPDVIINHIRSRKTHHSAAFQNFLKNLRQFTHSKLFNTHFFRQSAKNSEYRQRRTVIPYRLATIKNSSEARMPSYAPRVAGFA
ncbi:hypothetical protein [Paenibacillus harenae]|uniref:hypothetical protein n=1 Tax=Paenibacillus harenae TaxID=306543 RepID=UPI002792DDD0|nr:hypothetical protein [Paenibacillus harenae]MDQ0057931.1 hypothetical protein [Paenibacillus harenae]